MASLRYRAETQQRKNSRARKKTINNLGLIHGNHDDRFQTPAGRKGLADHLKWQRRRAKQKRPDWIYKK